MSLSIEIIEAGTSDEHVIRNLVRFYVYDMSEYAGWDCPETGLWGGCDDLPQYWHRPPEDPRDRWPDGWSGFPFVVRVDGRLAGFALVRRIGHDPPAYDMGEFFILRRFRRRGVGRHVACRIFDRFGGQWQIRQLPDNTPAVAFWREVIWDYTHGDFEDVTGPGDAHCDAYVVQRFSVRSREEA
ncbi:MAG: GNAT family N-acetyltransferase [Planctomycetota bacterium]|jgi:predicted acetyltransferase